MKYSREFLEEMLSETKKYVPPDLYRALVEVARPKAGGRALHRNQEMNWLEQIGMDRLTEADIDGLGDADFMGFAKRIQTIPGHELLKECVNRRRRKKFEKALWTTAFINDLPDSAFLYIEPGGETDAEKKTKPRTLRHMPYKDMDGKVDLPHLRNALARLGQVQAKGLDKEAVRAKAERVLDQEKERRGLKKCDVSFLASSLSPLEIARKEMLVGYTGKVFQETYLKQLGLERNQVHLGVVDAIEELDLVEPKVVVALGKEAAEKLGEVADFVLPHPEAIKKHGDSGEVERKCKAIKKSLIDMQEAGEYFKNRFGWLIQKPEAESKTETVKKEASGNSMQAVAIAKSDSLKRIIYGVVSDPYGANGAEFDAHNDWIPPAAIEKAAHEFLKANSPIFMQHQTPTAAKVVESWVEQYPDREQYLKAMNNEPHKVGRRPFGDDVLHSGSWVMGVELSEPEWQMFEKGELNGFSIGGMGERSVIAKDDVPKVEFVDFGVMNNAE